MLYQLTWQPINDLMDGGLGPGELGVVVTPFVGKTWILTKIETQNRSTRFECSSLYIRIIRTLCRLQDMILYLHKYHPRYKKDRKEEVRSKIEGLKGKLLIKYFPPKGVTVKKLQQHIEKMIATDNKPDVIIVDWPTFYFPIPIRQTLLIRNKGSLHRPSWYEW